MLKRVTIIATMLLTLFAQAQVSIDPDDAKINYWGRIDFSNVKSPTFAYSGVTIKAQFTGTSISAKLNDFAIHGSSTTNYFYKIIDGGTPQKFEALKGTNSYVLASGLTADTHTVELIKLTEANVGKTSFLGFTLDNGAKLISLAEPSCRIEFIGNSITCGYGNDTSIAAPPAGNPGSGFTSKNENNYKAWGYVAANQLGMKYNSVCYSGRGLYRNNSGSSTGVLPDIYDKIFPDDANSPVWNHTAYRLNYIVIDLGTNDFYPDPTSPVDQAAFEAKYVEFVQKLKSYHPNATVILAVGVMMSDGYPVGANQWTRIRTYVKNAVKTITTAGYNNVHYFEMDPQSAPYGEDWHPSAATHNTMGTNLANFIKGLNQTCTTSGPDYAIANWLDNKKAAVALTFDDWSAGHPAIVVPELKKRNINGTFGITNALGTPNWSAVRDAYAQGNEIANHTKTHRDLTTSTAAQITDEVRGAKSSFQASLNGGKVLSFIYPFGAFNQVVIDSLKASNHIGARTVYPSSGNYTYNFAPTDNDYFKILTTGMDSSITIDKFYAQINSIISGGGLLTYLYHSIYSSTVADNNYAKIPLASFTKQLDTLVSEKDRVWIATFGQALQYHKEKKTAVLAETSAPFAAGNTWKLNLSDQLPDSMYFQALTVQVKIPSTVTNVLSVLQNGKQLTFKISLGNLIFNAVPDAGEITVNVSNCVVPVLNLYPTSGKASYCTPRNAVLNVDHATGNTYNWYLNGTVIPQSDNDTLLVSNPGVYSVEITNNGCTVSSATYGKTITVSNSGNCGEPKAGFVVDKDPSTLSQELNITNTSTNTEPTSTYLWSFGEEILVMPAGTKATTLSGFGSFVVKFQTAGTKTVKLVVTGTVKNDTVSKVLSVLSAAPCVMNEDFADNSYLSNLGGWNNYSYAVDNSALKVTVPAADPNEWHSFNMYFRNENNEKINIDFSDITKKPFIRFVAKASDTLTLKVSMVDSKGIIADGAVLSAKSKFDVTGTNKLYELDLRGLFFNQWNSTVLDSTKISGIEFRINSGYASYPFKNSFGQTVSAAFAGTLEIDWIGVNDLCPVPTIIAINDQTISENSLSIAPNPVANTLTLVYEGMDQSWVIMNLAGNKTLSGRGKSVDVSSLNSGVYLIKVGSNVMKFVKQ